MRQASKPPTTGRRFYFILDNEDGTVDVYLRPRVVAITDSDGETDYDIEAESVARGVIPWIGMEDDIRARFNAWYESGDKFTFEGRDSSMTPNEYTPEEINPEEIEFEPEYEPDTPQLDQVFVIDGRGKAIELEVADDD